MTRRTSSPPVSGIRWTLEPFAATGAADVWLDLLNENQSFFAARIGAEVAAQHRLLHCRSPAEFFGIQAEFFQQAVTDYRAHAGRLMDLGAKAAFPGDGADQPKT
ncbi:phasin family protein [Salipiger mucosus]|uniref:Phasin domain-containing protein n=1 Tax=Salipiger mucosus DSM 16094 TaxID=1123237 RepID=S9S070_9RHOB|nr:phasin family protein [Salipiger mucosus]EPX79604.1 hypothetical protein Salmuc_05544 [Salipiger mucosus DSM 16094]